MRQGRQATATRLPLWLSTSRQAISMSLLRNHLLKR